MLFQQYQQHTAANAYLESVYPIDFGKKDLNLWVPKVTLSRGQSRTRGFGSITLIPLEIFKKLMSNNAF